MKKWMLVAALATVGMMPTALHAQQNSSERKAERDSIRARLKSEEKAEAQISYRQAVQALNENQFALEADQVTFRTGETAYVNSNTNFVLVNGQRGTVQVAFNTPVAGPNGIGGVTVDGNVSGMKISTDKKGNVSCSFNIQGIGISAQVFLTLQNGSNNATVTVSPNFNNRNLTLSGTLTPLEQSSVFKGRSW